MFTCVVVLIPIPAAKIEKALDGRTSRASILFNNTKRVYPYGNVGVQILSFVNADNEGGFWPAQYYHGDIYLRVLVATSTETGAGGTPIARRYLKHREGTVNRTETLFFHCDNIE